ncbi:MAG: hypothetical protein WCG99_04000 [Candidatus Berkelbacteria bacterium]
MNTAATLRRYMFLTTEEKATLAGLAVIVFGWFALMGLVAGTGIKFSADATRLLSTQGLVLNLGLAVWLWLNKPTLLHLWEYIKPGESLRRNLVICLPAMMFVATCAVAIVACIVAISVSLLTSTVLPSVAMAEIGLCNCFVLLALEKYCH